MKKILVYLTCFILLISCNKSELNEVHVTGITFDQTTITLTEGEKDTLVAIVSPHNATNKMVLWSTSNKKVATIDDDGIVSAVAKGEAIITATSDDSGKQAMCTIIVNPRHIPVTGISLTETSLNLTVNDEYQLTANITPEDATDKSIEWSSSNDAIVTVEDGLLKAVAAGQATITAKTNDGGKEAICVVNIDIITSVVTGEATKISPVSVSLLGKANLPSRTSSDIKIGILYSTMPGVLPGSSVDVEATEFDASYNFSVNIKSLEPESTYFYRSYIKQNSEMIYGDTKEFKTLAVSSVISSCEACDITEFEAQLKASLEITDVNYDKLEYGFNYGDSATSLSYTIPCYNLSNKTYYFNLQKLNTGKEYFFQAYVMVNGIYGKGEIKSFTTVEKPALMTLDPATLNFEKAASGQTIQVTCNRDWKVVDTNFPEWVALTVNGQDIKGKTQRPSSEPVNVTVYVLANEGYTRSADIVFDGGTLAKRTLTIKQAGSASCMTIAEVRALNTNKNAKVYAPKGTFIKGNVISNMTLNNLNSQALVYVQDATAGICIKCSANHSFAFGDEVVVDLSGVSLEYYSNLFQANGVALDKISTLSSGKTPEVVQVSVADFLAGKYESRYVELNEDVQVVEADLSKNWVVGDSHTSIKMETKSGSNFIVQSSKYSSFKDTKVSQGSGKIKGIATVYNDQIQIAFAQLSDFAGLTGERFAIEVPKLETEKISEVIAAADNTEVTLKNVTVVAASITTNKTTGEMDTFMVEDAEHAKLLVFGAALGTIGEGAIIVGDVVTVKGTRSTYSETPQLANPTVTKTGTGSVSYPSAKDISSEFDTSKPKVGDYVKFTGKLNISGNYYNVSVDGASRVKGSFFKPKFIDVTSFNDVPNVTYTGYYLYHTSNRQYLNIIVTDVKASDAPAGDGTLDNPYNVSGVIAFAKTLSSTEKKENVYVKGVVSQIDKPEDIVKYGNVTYYISDDGKTTVQFQIYRGFGLNGEKIVSQSQIAVGDQVVVLGTIKNYNGNTPKMDTGSKLISTTNTTPYLSVSPETITVGAAETSAQFNVSSNIESWTCSVDNGASVDKSSSSKSQTVTITFDANTDTENAKTYTVTVKGGDITNTLTITQKAAGAIELTFPDDNNANNAVDAYFETWTAKKDGETFSMVNFNNHKWKDNWSYIKCGRKNNTSVATITNDAAFSITVSKVVVTVDKVTADKVNSTKLEVSTSKNFDADVQTVNVTIKAGENEYVVPTPAANLYYRLTFDCASASSNGIIQISKVTYQAK